MPAENTYSVEAVRALDTHRTPIQKQPEMLLCLVRISRRYYLGDEVYGPVQLNPCSKSHKEVSLGLRQRSWGLRSGSRGPRGAAAREVPPPEDVPAANAPEVGQAEEIAATDPSTATKSRKRVRDRADVNAPAKVLRRDHADPRPTGSTRGGKSLAAIELGLASTRPETQSLGMPLLPPRSALLESEADMKKAAEDRSAGLSQELEDMRAQFSDLQVSTLQEQVSGVEKLKAGFEEFKQYEDSRVEQRCAEMDARLDALSIDFDEELSRESTGYTPYPHPETAGNATVLSRNKSQILSGGRDMDLFNLIRAPNPTKVKIGSRLRAAYEVPLLTLTANRVVEIEDPAAATDSSSVPSTINRSPLDFANEAGASDQVVAALEVPPPERCRRPRTCQPPTLLREYPWGKSLAAIELGLASTRPVPAPENAPAGVSDPDPLSFADPQSRHPADIAQSPDSIYWPEWGVPNGSMPDTPEACQDLVDHVAPPGYFSELRHLHNDDFLGQYNVNLARQVAMGSQLRLRFEQEAKLLRKSVAQADMKKATEDWSARLSQELEDMRAQFSDLQVSNERLSQQVATLQEQVSGVEKLKAGFEEFKQYKDSWVEQRCTEMDARLDALSIDFDEELYPHMLIAIAGRGWVIGHGLCLAVMKCGESLELRQEFTDVVSAGIAKGMSEGLRHGVEHGQAQLSLESIEAYDSEDAPMDVIMAAMYLESDTGDDAPQHVRDLRLSSSQLTIPVYPEMSVVAFCNVLMYSHLAVSCMLYGSLYSDPTSWA
nr:hypothetical protein [Tanacetum cinerariifolium]